MTHLRIMLASIFLRLYEGRVLDYVSHVNLGLIYADCSIPSFIFSFYMLWKTMAELYNVRLLASYQHYF